MRIGQIILFSLCILTRAEAQDCGLSEVLKVTFYDDRVFDKLFIDYKGVGSGSFIFPKGKYAFIFPDSVFTMCYPTVHKDLIWAQQHIHTIPYVHNDSTTVFVTYYLDNNIPFNIIFDEIKILEDNARVRFRTSCDCQERTVGTLHRFDVTLIRKKKEWRITSLKSQTEYGCRWTNPVKIRKENIININLEPDSTRDN